MSRPWISVIVPTYNRSAIAEELVACLEGQTISAESFEVIVVDDGSSDDTTARLQARAVGSHCHIKTLRQDNAGPAAARNLGAAAACGAWLYFIDDDQRPNPDWLTTAVRIIRSHPEGCAITSGVFVSKSDPIGWYNYQQSDIYRSADTITATTEVPAVLPGNLLIARSVFVTVGGYDHASRIGETETMSRRLRELGVRIWHEPALAMAHITTHRQTASDFFAYYARVAHGDRLQFSQAGQPARHAGKFVRITLSIPLIPARLMRRLPAYRQAGFGWQWCLTFLWLDLAGLLGYRIGYWHSLIRLALAIDR